MKRVNAWVGPYLVPLGLGLSFASHPHWSTESAWVGASAAVAAGAFLLLALGIWITMRAHRRPEVGVLPGLALALWILAALSAYWGGTTLLGNAAHYLDALRRPWSQVLNLLVLGAAVAAAASLTLQRPSQPRPGPPGDPEKPAT